jgi:hypothetical protein
MATGSPPPRAGEGAPCGDVPGPAVFGELFSEIVEQGRFARLLSRVLEPVVATLAGAVDDRSLEEARRALLVLQDSAQRHQRRALETLERTRAAMERQIREDAGVEPPALGDGPRERIDNQRNPQGTRTPGRGSSPTSRTQP